MQELAHLTSLSKQAASRILVDLAAKGLVEKAAGDLDGRRRTAVLTARGEAFESAIGERLRDQIARAYRAAAWMALAGARRILAALAGGRTRSPSHGPQRRRRMSQARTRHLLIVDDDDRIRELLKEYLAPRRLPGDLRPPAARRPAS